jgi:GNAT superfamily N-acetyltransferase
MGAMPTPAQPPNARGLTAPPPPPLRAPDARADARREYAAAAAGGLYLDTAYLRALPPYIDDVTQRMGGGTYEQMLKDEAVHSAFRTVVLSVLSDGVNVRPCVDDKDDSDFETAKEYADECQAVLDQGGDDGDGLDLEHLASELLYSLAVGWVAAEKVVGVLDGGKYDGLQCWESVRAKPRRNVTPVVDPFNRLRGYLCRMPGLPLSQFQGQVVGDPTKLPNYLPADKFCHAAWDVREHDPRGQSILRPVYPRWYEKQQVAADWLKHLGLFGSPWVVGKTAGATQALPAVDTLGNPTGEASDAVTPEQAFLNQILLFRNGGAIVVPAGWELDLLQVTNAGDAFLRKIDSCDRAMTQGITLQTLATTEGEHQARAAAQVHQDTLGLVPGWVRRWLARLLARSLLRPLVRMNHGDAAVRLAPVVKLEAAQQEDRAKLITAYAGAGWKFAPSQLPAVDEELGFEPRTPEEAQPPPPVPPPGAPPGGRPGAPPAPGTPPGRQPPPAAFAWDESQHPRGQPGNKGQFGPGGGGGADVPRPRGRSTRYADRAPAPAAVAPAPAAAPSAAPPAPPKKKTFGKSKARLAYRKKSDARRIEGAVARLFGEDFSPDDVASLVGAPDDAHVTVAPDRTGGRLHVTVEHPDFVRPCKRILGRDFDGRVFVENELIDLRPEVRGKGLGTDIFGRQVEQAAAAGVSYIKCHAARQTADGRDYFNGYYTWPLLGYDEHLSVVEMDTPDVAARARAAFPGAKSVLQLMAAPGGRAWWKENGTDLHGARFDLAEGSPSRQVFDAYLEERAARA